MYITGDVDIIIERLCSKTLGRPQQAFPEFVLVFVGIENPTGVQSMMTNN